MAKDENDGDQLSVKQEQLITFLLQGQSITSGAKAVGVHERTARRWVTLPYFKAAYREAQARLFDEHIDKLVVGVPAVLSAMLKHVRAEVEPTAATQIRAAQVWLEQAVAQRKMAELELKIVELEELIKGSRS